MGKPSNLTFYKLTGVIGSFVLFGTLWGLFHDNPFTSSSAIFSRVNLAVGIGFDRFKVLISVLVIFFFFGFAPPIRKPLVFVGNEIKSLVIPFVVSIIGLIIGYILIDSAAEYPVPKMFYLMSMEIVFWASLSGLLLVGASDETRFNATMHKVYLACAFSLLFQGSSAFPFLAWEQFSGAVMQTSAGILQFFGADAGYNLDAFKMGIYQKFWIRIDPSCSGIDGMAVGVTFVAVFFYFFREQIKFPRALLLLPLIIGLCWFANVLRVASLVFIGGYISKPLALEGFHNNAGWLFINMVCLVFLYLVLRSKFFTRNIESTSFFASPTTQYLAPQLVLIAVGMVTGSLLYTTVDWFYFVRIVVAGALLICLRKLMQSINWFCGIKAALACGFGIGIGWIILESLAIDPAHNILFEQQLYSKGQLLAVLWIGLRLIGTAVVVPLVEELAFRGYLLRRIMGADFTAVEYRQVSFAAIAISSVVFGALHQQFVGGVVAGLIFAWLVKRYNGLGPAVVAHMTANLVIGLYGIIAGQWSLF